MRFSSLAGGTKEPPAPTPGINTQSASPFRSNRDFSMLHCRNAAYNPLLSTVQSQEKIMGRPGRRLGSSSAGCSRRPNRQMHQTEPSDDRRKTPGSAMTAARRRFVFEKARQPGLQAGFRIDGGPPKVLIYWIRTINVMLTSVSSGDFPHSRIARGCPSNIGT